MINFSQKKNLTNFIAFYCHFDLDKWQPHSNSFFLVKCHCQVHYYSKLSYRSWISAINCWLFCKHSSIGTHFIRFLVLHWSVRGLLRRLWSRWFCVYSDFLHSSNNILASSAYFRFFFWQSTLLILEQFIFPVLKLRYLITDEDNPNISNFENFYDSVTQGCHKFSKITHHHHKERFKFYWTFHPLNRKNCQMDIAIEMRSDCADH